jgi:hypothetical protein
MDNSNAAADFATAVLAAAAQVPAAGRFGADRVFVSALWKQLGEQRDALGPSFDAFKARLLKANRELKLTLARADMPGAMDRATVAASEIAHLNSTFHLVVDPSRS